MSTKEIRYKNVDYLIGPEAIVLINVRAVFSASTEKNWEVAQIDDMLDTQFTAFLLDDPDRLVFRHYTDIGNGWKPVESA